MIASLFLLTTAEGHAYDVQKERYDLWIEACLHTQYSCQGVKPPKVRKVHTRTGLYGYYDGGGTIFISNKLTAEKRRATIYHEMVHYLQAKVGGLPIPGPASLICEAEAEAFAETDERWVRIGLPHRQRGADWWKPYRHCRQFYESRS